MFPSSVCAYPPQTAYFGQHSSKELDLEKSAIEFMCWKFPKENAAVLKTHLSKTSVGDSIVDSRMKNLSFSQRSCVIFAALTFVPPHLLIMDEPTVCDHAINYPTVSRISWIWIPLIPWRKRQTSSREDW